MQERIWKRLLKGLSDDIMDVIATDHAPHSAEEKARSITEAPFGIVGLGNSSTINSDSFA